MKKIRNFFKNTFNKITLFYENKIRPRKDKVISFILKYLGISFVHKQFLKLNAKRRKAVIGLLFVLPWLVGLYIFGLQPFIQAIRISLADQAKYVIDLNTNSVAFEVKGWTFKHFISLFKTQPDHVELVFDVFLDILLIVPLVMVFALVLALMINQNIKGKGIFRVIFFIPVILLSGSMLYYFSEYNLLRAPAVESGAITSGIYKYLPAQLASLITLAFEKIVLILWLSGVQTLIFLAGLQKADKTVYEAASIDGANLWDSFWKITLPGLHSLMIINIIYTAVIYANLSNNRLVVLIENTLVDVRFGRPYSTALAWILFVIELLIIGIYTLLIKLSNKRYQ
ncbi:MAG: sugar ABC transporter permease [Acholeplasmatales bacterium]|jgi:ABC-type sugar transport system permease subunit|nr:sugar ABC transporter permease [Acholeplasmataceae bacterium]MDY0115861.1 sugar ABC transporter permease [Acholeplasmatales bacterium]MCK9234358.1 sugar ABC transporter permease [Acholeplasmataceae bacterium]MCK9289069.1 sugar ABC transporter permease [Acholeplasmataceae bacterium]MCK9427370.1 sugar ABC transporter permease [Acholeplasmataceae bacterium]